MTLIPETKAKTTSTDRLAERLISMGGKVAGYNKPDNPKATREWMNRAFNSEHYKKYGPEVPYGAVPHSKERPAST